MSYIVHTSVVLPRNPAAARESNLSRRLGEGPQKIGELTIGLNYYAARYRCRVAMLFGIFDLI